MTGMYITVHADLQMRKAWNMGKVTRCLEQCPSNESAIYRSLLHCPNSRAPCKHSRRQPHLGVAMLHIDALVLIPGKRLPDPHRLVPTTGGHHGAAGAPSHALHFILVPLQRCYLRHFVTWNYHTLAHTSRTLGHLSCRALGCLLQRDEGWRRTHWPNPLDWEH